MSPRRARPGLGRITVMGFDAITADTPSWVVRTVREPPVIKLERCPVCKEWLPKGSREDGQCRACGAWVE